MSLTQRHVSIGNFICVEFALVLMMCQFMPFWTVPETGTSCFIGTYVGFPQDNPELMSYLETAVGESDHINSIVFAPALTIALGAAPDPLRHAVGRRRRNAVYRREGREKITAKCG